MNELRKEYQAIFDALCGQEGISADTILKCALQDCQRLADSKEPVLLSDEDIRGAYKRAGYKLESMTVGFHTFARIIEAAVHAKQRPPVVKDVVVRIYQSPNGKLTAEINPAANFPTNWTLLKEVTIPVELK